MTIYGNTDLLRLIRTMAKRACIPHACLLYGEKGLGKKTIARYLAMAALCTGEEKPCGTCPSCRKMLHECHPDMMEVEHSGKRNGFSVETVRTVCRESIVAPNDGERKVYLFADCDAMDIRSQNTLLKLTEEPPEHVLLLFTAEHKGVFLDTMLSRMMPLAVSPCPPDVCREALCAMGCTAEQAATAAGVCGGNIGKSLAWLHSEQMQEMTKQIAAVTRAMAQHSQYDILRVLFRYEKDRTAAMEFLKLLDVQLRDAAAMKFLPENRTGCDAESAAALSRVLPVGRFMQLHEAIEQAYAALQANVSTKLTLSALGGMLG